MKRIPLNLVKDKIGEKVKVAGWVDARRDHGKLIFFDLRDASGKIQCVAAGDGEVFALADSLRPEWVVEVVGEIKERPPKMVNPELELGNLELEAEEINVLNESKTPPFELGSDGYEIGEENRLKYRYLDLRRPRLHRNLKIRSRAAKHIRDYLEEKSFVEIETPLLTKSTPEGARDFIVPSRLQRGKFYALPQSPQQYKQLLMVAGIERYFQIARCLRDEDTRGDRQPEFTQIDIEKSFTDEEEIMALTEEMVLSLVKEVFPEKKILQTPFPRISYAEAMEKYGSDRPDLRKSKNDGEELAFLWVVDFPLFEYSEKEGRLVSAHHPFTYPKEEDMGILEKEPEKARARSYDLVLNGFEVGGGSIRIHRRDLQEKIFRILGLEEEKYRSQFGHLLDAFEYGAPPHGGIALGFDRLLAILLAEPNIREVIAFPKTGDGRDLMMGAPSELDKNQLKELGIRVEEENK